MTMTVSRLITGTPEQFIAASEADLQRAREAVVRLKAGGAALAQWDLAVAALGDAGARASVARNAHPDPAMRSAAEKCEQEAAALSTALSLDPEIFAALSALPAGDFYLERTLRDFRRAGVDKDPATRDRVRALNEELVKIGQEFSRNIREDVRSIVADDLAGLPDDYIRAHPDQRITTDYPDYVPFMTYARSSKAREELWRVYRQRAHPQNGAVLQRMLEKRHELARLLGYESWAAYVTEDKMIGSAGAARDFIERITAASGDRAQRDYDQLRGDAAAVEPWDAEYLKERIRADRYAFDSQSVRPYFEISSVQRGLFELTSKLFGIEYRASDAPVWHPDVTAWDVLEDGACVGRFFLDLFPREGKYKHAAQFTLASGVAGGALPEAALLCNFPQKAPALMEHSEVVTFFHEFGHLLHHLLGGRTRWAGLSGVSTEWDFVEAPSQMLEEWCWDAEVLSGFARHIESDEPIPAELVARMRAADEFGKGMRVRQQMFYAATSLSLHDRDPAGLDATALVAGLQSRYTPFRAVPGTYFHESFGHLEGYSAIYYTYMWSLVIAKDLFTTFRREGLLNPAPARRYRKAVLEPGGSRKAADLVRDFLGRPYDFNAFEQWLNAT
jgi:thimet oligopeptidase